MIAEAAVLDATRLGDGVEPACISEALLPPLLGIDGMAGDDPVVALQFGGADRELEAALLDPAGCFAHPMAVVTHPRFTPAQMEAVLARWAWDARLIEIAHGEGMRDDGEPSRLQEVLAARRALAAAAGPKPACSGLPPALATASAALRLAA